MDEHDDDLTSEVHDDAQLEKDAYPDTGDELDESEASDGVDGDPPLDDDEAEM